MLLVKTWAWMLPVAANGMWKNAMQSSCSEGMWKQRRYGSNVGMWKNAMQSSCSNVAHYVGFVGSNVDMVNEDATRCKVCWSNVRTQ